MKPGVGTLDVYPSIWGRECTDVCLPRHSEANTTSDWAGGPGDSKDDVEWLDNKIAQFFADNKPTGVHVNTLTEKLQTTLI